MRFVFLNNKINLHQFALADAMYEVLGKDFVFIETSEISEEYSGFINSEDYYENRPFILRMYESMQNERMAYELINSADAIRVGGKPFSLVQSRIEKGKLTFRSSERLFKTPVWRHRPSTLYQLWKSFGKYSNLNYRLLCQSAYLPNDVRLFGDYEGKCYKFAYFTSIPSLDIDKLMLNKRKDKVQIVWCARFIALKHPELLIQLALKLIASGRNNFEILMIGPDDTELWNEIRSQINQNELAGYVTLMGGLPNEIVLEQMRESNIFLFTSDRNEGWGVVLNEAMSAGCACVVSNEIGSAPFLLKNRINGALFESKSADSLFDSVAFLYDYPELCQKFGKAAYHTISTEWSAKAAAERLVMLSESILEGDEKSFSEGPCSKAFPCNSKEVLNY